MSTSTVTYPDVIHVRRALAIGITAILIFTSLAWIAGSILGVLSSTTPDTFQADRIPVVQNSIVPIAVPTPAVADIQPLPSETQVPIPVTAVGSSVVPIAVPTPPLSIGG